MKPGFSENLAFGQVGESAIARWCKSRGHCVLPVYEKEIDSGKGPRLFAPSGQIVAPDMMVIPQFGDVVWIEAKHKTVFSWHRISRRWVTGIDLHHYQQYQEVEHRSARRVWMFFLHRSDTPAEIDISHGCPPQCPVGLFVQSLRRLMLSENHRSQRHGRSGMVYWAVESLKLQATLDEVESLTRTPLEGCLRDHPHRGDPRAGPHD